MNGYQFFREALSETRNELDSIIELVNREETEWIEFKASIKRWSPEKYNIDDYTYHISKALIAMANGVGGIVILGVDDDGKAVGLEDSGYKENKDKFARRLTDLIIAPKNGWNTRTEGLIKYKTKTDSSAFSLEWGKYEGQDVIVFFIQPREKGKPVIKLIKQDKITGNTQEIIYRRVQGDVGSTSTVPLEEEVSWLENRNSNYLSPKFKSYLRELKKSSPKIYEAMVKESQNNLVVETQKQANKYVSLDVRVFTPEVKTNQKLQRDDKDWLDTESSRNFTLNFSNKGSFIDLAKQTFPSYIEGEPGGGKSTSLINMAREIALEWSSPESNWAVFVSLSNYTSSGLKSLILHNLRLKWFDISDDLQSGKLYLILDGLNECPSFYYEQCLEELSDLLKENKDAKVFISSRYTHSPPFALNKIEIRPMQKTQQSEFLQKYLDGVDIEPVQILEQLSSKQTFNLIARSPILLRISVWVFIETGNLPSGLAALYDAFLNTWVTRELQKDLDSGQTKIWDENQVKECLSLLAFRMRGEGRITLSSEEVIDVLMPILGKDSKVFVDRFAQGLLVELNKFNSIQFAHETILEFLVAVFLTNHAEHNLLSEEIGLYASQWAMPIVFAFELFDNPPEYFIQSAWRHFPLLVAAALRDTERLNLLPPPEDTLPNKYQNLWHTGVIEAMRKRDISDITNQLALTGRTPPRHELPDALISTLKGRAFWYAISSHSEGNIRLDLLQHLLIDHRDLWTEVLPYVIAIQPDWIDQLSDSQQLLTEDLEITNREDAIKEASVYELCYMVRNRIISDPEFRANWKAALNNGNEKPLQRDILALMGTRKIKADQLNGKQRDALRNIGMASHSLSPRVTYQLIHANILKPDEIRSTPERVIKLVNEVSPVNASRLIKKKVLLLGDFNFKQKQDLLNRCQSPNDISALLEIALFTRKEIPTAIHNRIYGTVSKEIVTTSTNLVRSALRSKDSIAKKNTLSELNKKNIEKIYLSAEELELKEIKLQMEDPLNFSPGSGYHKKLTDKIETARNWPAALLTELLDLSEGFYKKYGSKKKFKYYRDFVRSIR